MECTIIINGRSYDLPKKTMRIAERLEDVVKKDQMNGLSIRQKFENTHACIKEILGAENTKEIFGSEDIEDIDLCDVALAFKMIVDSYAQPLKEYNSAKIRNSISSIPFDKLASVADVMQKVSMDGKQ